MQSWAKAAGALVVAAIGSRNPDAGNTIQSEPPNPLEGLGFVRKVQDTKLDPLEVKDFLASTLSIRKELLEKAVTPGKHKEDLLKQLDDTKAALESPAADRKRIATAYGDTVKMLKGIEAKKQFTQKGVVDESIKTFSRTEKLIREAAPPE